MAYIVLVALPTPLRRLFEYSSPSAIAAGCRVRVPFGHQTLVGVVVGQNSSSQIDPRKLKQIEHIIDQEPVLPAQLLELASWCADYYQHPIGEVISAILPTQLRKDEPAEVKLKKVWQHSTEGKGLPASALKSSKKQQQLHQHLLEHAQASKQQLLDLGISASVIKALAQKGLIEEIEVEQAQASNSLNAEEPTQANFTHTRILAETPQSLNPEQSAALDQLRYHQFNCYLLEGATGSGKTEVYLHAIARALQAGKQALVLVPEIGLAPQTLKRFRQRFATEIVELHSNIAEKQRGQNWLRAKAGLARIVIGTRLACLSPMPQLGLIIVDEEHDLSFKQQDGLRYSARDLAILRAHKLQIPLILGSATPSLESLHKALQGRYQHLKLTQRAGQAKPPKLQLIDCRNQNRDYGFCQESTDAIKQCIDRNEQVLVFINRRGFAPQLMCEHCGWQADCKACASKMTLHQHPKHLRCHHCDQQRPVPQRCPCCQNSQLSIQGFGTERTEEGLQAMFPGVEVIRVDQDSMQSKTAMERLNQKLGQGDACILVGTQMLAKGHHFPKVTLAVLLDVDQGLFSGDFRGAERMGQLIVQVAGRAGRGELPGRVLIQSFQPDHPMLTLLLQQGYHNFGRQLLDERHASRLPPFWHMALLRAESKRAENAQSFLKYALGEAKKIMPPSNQLQYLGPLPSLLEKKQDRFRFQLQVSALNRSALQHLLKHWVSVIESHALARRTRWSIDVDPQDMS